MSILKSFLFTKKFLRLFSLSSDLYFVIITYDYG
jgi:hypothetical protein